MHLSENGKMEVTKQPIIPICEVHFHGYAVRTASIGDLKGEYLVADLG